MKFCEIEELNNKQIEYLKKEGFRNVSSFYALNDSSEYYSILLSYNEENNSFEFSIRIKGKESYSESELNSLQAELNHLIYTLELYKMNLEDLK
jgi:hypothetical protein